MRVGTPSREAATRLTGSLPWRSPRQVHGARILVGALGPDQASEADGLVALPGDSAPLAVLAADCALIGLASPEGVRAVVHAGWPGVLAGVVEAAAATMRRHGATRIVAWRGPCIHPECYEFGAADLARVAAAYGEEVRSVTTEGGLALDLPEAVRRAAACADVELAGEVGSCTACATSGSGPLWFSHRARRDEGRHALVVVAER